MLAIEDCPSTSVMGLTPGGGWVASPSQHDQVPNELEFTVGQTVTIPPTMASGDGDSSLSFQSTRKTGGSNLLENPVLCLVEIIGDRPSVWTVAPENPLGIIFLVTVASARTPDVLPLVF